MAPKSKVSETGDIGHGVTFDVRPAKAGKPTVHAVINGSRLPAFRLKDGSSATEQVRRLQQVSDHLARSSAPIDAAGQPSGMAMDAMQRSQPTQPTHAATDAAQQEPPPPQHGCRREFQALARATAAAGCMVLPRTAAWAASESLPPPPWPFENWADGPNCRACGCFPLQHTKKEPAMPVVRCRGCDTLGVSYAFFCDVDCQRRTPCPHIGGVVDLSKPCSCECCACWYPEDLEEEKQELEEKQGNALFGPFGQDFDCTAEVQEFWDASFGKFKGRAKRDAYKEAMVRIQAGKQRKVGWAVGDVVEGMILVVEGRTWRPDWLLDAM